MSQHGSTNEGDMTPIFRYRYERKIDTKSKDIPKISSQHFS